MSFGNSLILHAKSYCVSTSTIVTRLLGLISLEFFALEFAQGDIDGGKTTFSIHLKVLKT